MVYKNVITHKVSTTMLSESSIAATATTALSDCTAVDLTDVVSFTLTARCTYDGSATEGITVNIYTSVDGTNWDTDALTSFQPSFTAGATVQKTVYIDPDCKYCKVRVTNDDGAQSVTTVTVKTVETKIIVLGGS